MVIKRNIPCFGKGCTGRHITQDGFQDAQQFIRLHAERRLALKVFLQIAIEALVSTDIRLDRSLRLRILYRLVVAQRPQVKGLFRPLITEHIEDAHERHLRRKSLRAILHLTAVTARRQIVRLIDEIADVIRSAEILEVHSMMMAYRPQHSRIFRRSKSLQEALPRGRMRLPLRIRPQDQLSDIMEQRRPLYQLTEARHAIIPSRFIKLLKMIS